MGAAIAEGKRDGYLPLAQTTCHGHRHIPPTTRDIQDGQMIQTASPCQSRNRPGKLRRRVGDPIQPAQARQRPIMRRGIQIGSIHPLRDDVSLGQ